MFSNNRQLDDIMSTLRFKRFSKPHVLKDIGLHWRAKFLAKCRDNRAEKNVALPDRVLAYEQFSGALAIVLLLPEGLPDKLNSVLYAVDEIATEGGPQRLRVVRRPLLQRKGEMLFRREITRVRAVKPTRWKGAHRVNGDGSTNVLGQSRTAPTPVTKSLGNWLRKQVRADTETHLARITARLGRKPGRVYVMAHRTKWGNGSSLQNLSFCWRLIIVPPMVLKYLMTHEAVPLAVTDHSATFWVMVQSRCPATERARRWLSRYGEEPPFELEDVLRRA